LTRNFISSFKGKLKKMGLIDEKKKVLFSRRFGKKGIFHENEK
jgi:hypothetical protein